MHQSLSPTLQNLFVKFVCLKEREEDILSAEELVLYNFSMSPFYIERY